jgi:hypothetical protein
VKEGIKRRRGKREEEGREIWEREKKHTFIPKKPATRFMGSTQTPNVVIQLIALFVFSCSSPFLDARRDSKLLRMVVM